jgi:hypothetical protein
MKTSELITLIIRAQAAGFTRSGDVLPMLREVVNILCKQEVAQFLYLDPATGRPQILTTVAGTMGPYDGPAGTWRVSNILLETPPNGDYGYVNVAENGTEPIEINGRMYFPVYYVKCEDALEDALPQIYFSKDPGASTTKYYMQAYKSPVQITSDRIQLPIPDSNGAHRSIVYPAVMALIEGQNNGNYAEAIHYIGNTLSPKLQSILDHGAQGKRHQVHVRPY